MSKKQKIQNCEDPRIFVVKFGNERIRLLNRILTRRERGSRYRREERRPGRAQSVVFVLEFLRFTDVRSGKAFEI